MKNLLKKGKYVLVTALCLMFGVSNVNAEELIDDISITGLKNPVIGETVGDNMSNVKVPDTANYSIIECNWWESDNGMYFGNLINSSIFETDYYYQYQITLKAKDGFDFLFDENGDFAGNLSTSSVDYVLTQQDNPGELLIVGKTILLLENDNASYKVTEGAGQVYTIGEDNTARFTVDANQKAFDGHIIYIDGVEFDWENYNYETENTTLILPKNYLDTLSIGEHSLKFIFVNDKETETTFTIAKKSADNKTHKVIEGADQTYTIDNTKEARFRIDADYNLFKNGGKVYVDDNLVAPSNYTSEEGSTIITLLNTFVDTLAPGSHTLKVEFNDTSVATTSFTVTKNTLTPTTVSNSTINPQTGDNIVLYITMLVLSLIGIIEVGLYNKKKVFR